MSTVETVRLAAHPSAAVALAAEVAHRWRRRGVRYSQVRDAGLDRHGVLEIDVLVHPDDLGRAEAAAAELGFVARPSWGRAPHRFLVAPAFDPRPAAQPPTWVKLDLVTDLCFGPFHEVRTSCVAGCLAESVADRGPIGSRLSPADEFAALVLHCVLDKRHFADQHRSRLEELAPAVKRTGRFGPAGSRPDHRGPQWEGVLDAVRAQRWSTLLAMGPRLAAAVEVDAPEQTSRRRRAAWVARRSTKLLKAARGRGRSVAVVGTDGTGKSTLVAAIAEAIPLEVRVLYGGTYRSGAGGNRLPLVNTTRVARRLVATQLASAYHRSRGRLVLLDRHPVEATVAIGGDRTRRVALRRRLLASLVARPDLMVVLDGPTDVVCARLDDPDRRRVVDDRAAHLELARRFDAVTIDASRPPATVRDEAVAVVWSQTIGLGCPSRSGTR